MSSSNKGKKSRPSQDPVIDMEYDIDLGDGVMASSLSKIRLSEKMIALNIDDNLDTDTIFVSMPQINKNKRFTSEVIQKTENGFSKVVPIVKSSMIGYINGTYDYAQNVTDKQHKEKKDPITGYRFSPKEISEPLKNFFARVKECMAKMLMYTAKRDLIPNQAAYIVAAKMSSESLEDIQEIYVSSPISVVTKEGATKEYINLDFSYYKDKKNPTLLNCYTNLYGPPIMRRGEKIPNKKHPHQLIPADRDSGYVSLFDTELKISLSFGAAPQGAKKAFFKAGINSAKYEIPKRQEGNYNPYEDDREAIQEATEEECKISEELASNISAKILGKQPSEKKGPAVTKKVKPPPVEEEEEEDEEEVRTLPKKNVKRKIEPEEDEDPEPQPVKRVMKKNVADEEEKPVKKIVKRKIEEDEEPRPVKKVTKRIVEEEEEPEVQKPAKKTVKKKPVLVQEEDDEEEAVPPKRVQKRKVE